MLDTNYYITEISERSDRRGDLLIKLMDICNVNSTSELSLEQLKQFYEEVKECPKRTINLTP